AAHRKIRVSVWNEKHTEKDQKDIRGPLLLVEMDAARCADDAAHQPWLEDKGIVPVLCAESRNEKDVGQENSPHMGEWFPAPPLNRRAAAGAQQINSATVLRLQFLAGELASQLQFPAGMLRFQAGWHAEDDARPQESPPENTLLASRLLIAQGIKALNYFPVQDGITPAGWETGPNRHFRWDAALDVSARRQPRARAVERNGNLLESWKEFLASAHPRADFGVVVTASETGRRAAMQILRVAALANLSAELIFPQALASVQLAHCPLVILPVEHVLENASPEWKLRLAEYIQQGGLLAGRISSAERAALEYDVRPSATGRMIEMEKDFYSWVPMEDSLAAVRGHDEAAPSVQALRALLESAGIRPAVKVTDSRSTDELYASQLVSNAGTANFGVRTAGRGLLSVTNLNYEDPVETSVQILSPRAGARGTRDDYIPLPISVPPHESLLLPLHFPLCATAKPNDKCEDEVVAAASELLWAERDGKTLELTFYAPTRAEAILHLDRQPSRVTMDEMRPDANWKPERKQLEISILRAPAPEFLRVVKIHLPYTPFVPEKQDASKHSRRDWEFEFVGGPRLPLGEHSSLAPWPPLALLQPEHEGQFVLQARNFDEMGRDVGVKIEGPVHGSSWIGLEGGETRQTVVHVRNNGKPGSPATPAPIPGGKMQSEMEIRAGRDRYNTPMFFVPLAEDVTSNYEYDFDRDGANEWVLETSALRAIVSPESGGRALALADKESGLSVFTTIGGFSDAWVTSSMGSAEPIGLYDRNYRAAWERNDKQPALRLTYEDASGKVSKTMRVDPASHLAMDYAVTAGSQAASQLASAAFLSQTSLPASFAEGRETKFCWSRSAPKENSDAARQCRPFGPGQEDILIPESVHQLEIENPGRGTMTVNWSAGQMAVVQKSFSAMLTLRVACLESGKEQTFRLKFALLPPK
ncbi:MAG: hypothetical protein HY046_06285, partial [Acidobacteria bacterium]|nr:hypothetical protein [Acidobacteriota bacterium]